MLPEAKFRPGAAILDMDGLMLDTERLTFELWPLAAQNCGLNLTPEIVMRTIGITESASRTIINSAFTDNFAYDKIHTEVKRLTREKVEQEGIALRPGLLSLLDCLEKRRIPFAVATSTGRKTAEWKLEAAGIRDRLTVLICGDEIKNGKPAPDIFLAAAAGLNAEPGNCAGFEDSGPGLLGLHAAGIPSVFIRDLADPSPEALATVWKQYQNLAEAAELFYN
jgi:HAD superfamily hydrolase (TIGR01509 family)